MRSVIIPAGGWWRPFDAGWPHPRAWFFAWLRLVLLGTPFHVLADRIALQLTSADAEPFVFSAAPANLVLVLCAWGWVVGPLHDREVDWGEIKPIHFTDTTSYWVERIVRLVTHLTIVVTGAWYATNLGVIVAQATYWY